jgi:hypothetical protein
MNVYSLDALLQEVYMYYYEKGIYSITIKRGHYPMWVPPLYVKVIR